jgi:hypothetical protein
MLSPTLSDMTPFRGGELFKHLSEQRRFSEERAKFYAA